MTETDFFKVKFNEDDWCIYLIDDDDDTIIDKENEAETDFEKKEIHFRKSGINIVNVSHELWHVYFNYCYLSDTTEISLGDMEEITAALFSQKGAKILERSLEVLNGLNDLKKKQQ